MLSEARAELDDFQHSSKELEEELERELDRTEKVQKELRVKVSVAESQSAEWKVRANTQHTLRDTTCSCAARTNLSPYKRIIIPRQPHYSVNSTISAKIISS